MGGVFFQEVGGLKGQLYLLCNQLTWLFADLVEYFWESINIINICKYVVVALLREFPANPGIHELKISLISLFFIVK